MASQATVMDPGEAFLAQLTLSLMLKSTTDKLRWRKDLGCWAPTIRACAEGGDGKCKGVLSALGMTIFRPLPSFRQQLVEKAIEMGIIVIDKTLTGCLENPFKTVDAIIDIFAMDSPTDVIRCLARLSKELCHAQSDLARQ